MIEQRTRFSKGILVITLLLILSCLSSAILAENHNVSYQLVNHPDGSTFYRLNVAVSETLYEYYLEKSHSLSTGNDFARFVTPYALKPIADSLREIYADDEDFANGVLMIVHQIPYEVTTAPKYPVEAIVENKGDCDLFSYIAASIVKAGGLDTVLLYYESESHMNIGINLSHAPRNARSAEYHVTSNDINYYVAECTGGNWQNGWRVGECPTDLRQASVQVIDLENSEQPAGGQVSASLQNLATSTVSLTVSPTFLVQEGTVSLSGQILPTTQNQTVTIYARENASPWRVLGTTTTDSNGRFTYAWNAETAGIYDVRASWSGNENYASADSPTRSVTILSTFFLILLSMIIILVCVGTVMFFLSRRTAQEIQEPQPPEIS